MCQFLIKKQYLKLSFKGIGVHTGKNVKLDILYASQNTGIVFKRVDLKK